MCQDGGLYHLYGFMLLITELHLICFHNFGSSYRTNLSPGLSFIIADFEMNPPTVLIFRTAGADHSLADPYGLVFDGTKEAFGKCPGFAPCFSTVFRSNDMTTPSGYVHTYFIIKL